jgi:hypothetical protein
MAKKILLCGEGPTDYGNPQYGSHDWEEGPIQSLIRKSVNGDIEFTYATKEDVRKKRIQRRTSAKVPGHGAKAYQLCLIAADQGDIDNIVCYVDADREHGSGKSRLEAQRRLQEVYNQISNGFQQFNQERSQNSIPMVPLKMIESWLLADEQAFTQYYGRQPTNPSLPGQPELIWGDENDPTSDHPKNYLKRVLEQYNDQANRDTFKSIAEEIIIDTLRRRCSLSFELFYQDAQAI